MSLRVSRANSVRLCRNGNVFKALASSQISVTRTPQGVVEKSPPVSSALRSGGESSDRHQLETRHKELGNVVIAPSAEKTYGPHPLKTQPLEELFTLIDDCITDGNRQAAYKIPGLLMALISHPGSYSSHEIFFRVSGKFPLLLHQYGLTVEDTQLTTEEVAGRERLKAYIEDGLSLYLLKSPRHLLRISNRSLDILLTAARDKSSTPPHLNFFMKLWEEVHSKQLSKGLLYKSAAKGSLDVQSCFNIGHSLLQIAEEGCLLLQGIQSVPSDGEGGDGQGSMASCMHPDTWSRTNFVVEGSSSRRGQAMYSRAFSPSLSLWPLHRLVHSDIFDSVSARLSKQIKMAGFIPGEDASTLGAWSLAQGTGGLLFPNDAQKLLLSAAAFNTVCQHEWRHACGCYVSTLHWWKIAAEAALAPLPVMIATRADICRLMEALSLLGGKGDWQASRQQLKALDDALAMAGLPSHGDEPLAYSAHVLRLRSGLGPLPSSSSSEFMQQIEEAILTSRVICGGLFLQDQDTCFTDSNSFTSAASSPSLTASSSSPYASSLSELHGLCGLIEVVSGDLANRAYQAQPSGLKGFQWKSRAWSWYKAQEDMKANKAAIDVEVLFNKVFLSLALSGPELWQSQEFLCRVYPRLVKDAKYFCQRQEDLLPDRYAVAVQEALSIPWDHQQGQQRQQQMGDIEYIEGIFGMSEVEGFCRVLSAIECCSLPWQMDDNMDSSTPSTSSWLDASWQECIDAHCSRLLAGGISNNFIRREHWIQLLTLVGDRDEGKGLRLACPRLAAVVAWALAHESQPFGTGAEMRIACMAWLGMMTPSLTSAWGSRSDLRSVKTLGLPGLPKAVDESLISACLVQGRYMKLDSVVEDVELWHTRVESALLM